MCTIFGTKQNSPFVLNKKFFGTNHCYYFHLPIGPFHCAKLKKKFTADPELWQCTIFGLKMVHLPQTNFFLENNLYHFHLPISPFHWAKFKNVQIYEYVQFWGPEWPISPNENFFRKPVHEPCFFYSCLSTCQKSKLDINLLLKYWWLNNSEISLAESHFAFNLRIRFFPRMQFSQDVNKP